MPLTAELLKNVNREFVGVLARLVKHCLLYLRMTLQQVVQHLAEEGLKASNCFWKQTR